MLPTVGIEFPTPAWQAIALSIGLLRPLTLTGSSSTKLETKYLRQLLSPLALVPNSVTQIEFEDRFFWKDLVRKNLKKSSFKYFLFEAFLQQFGQT